MITYPGGFWPRGEVYQDQRECTLTYDFAVPNGSYKAQLKFAELYWTAAGSGD